MSTRAPKAASAALPRPRTAAQLAEDEVAALRAQVASLQHRLAQHDHEQIQLRASQAELQLVVESLPQIVWIARPDGWHVYYNQKWFDFTGLTLEESLGHGWNPPFHPEDRPHAAAKWAQATSTGEPYEVEYRLRRWDGTYHWMLGRAMPIRNAAGEVVKWFGTCTDIEELKQAQGRVADQAQLLELAQDAIFVQDLEQNVLHWNPAAERIYGWSAEQAVGRPIGELMCPERNEVEAARRAVLSEGEWSGELRFVDRSGAHGVMESRWTLLRHEDGTPRGVLTVNTDVTERRATEAEFIRMLEQQASHDPLTGLPNRTLLADRLDQLVAAAERSRSPLAVLFVDLDGFKDINDSEGHLLGDKVLVEVAERLRSKLRAGDTVARFGGDEFVVLLPDTGPERADEVAHRLLEAVREPMLVERQRLRVSVSIGVAVSPPVEPAALLRSADAAVYHAKAQGRDQVRCFVGELSSQAEARLHMSADLADALGSDGLRLVYQPIVSLCTGRVIGLETLARWDHPERGSVPPDVFVGVAEKTGLARQLDEWVLRRACRQIAALRKAGAVDEEITLSVNVTAADVGDPDFPALVRTVLEEHELPPQRLVVEITETSFIGDMAAAAATLAALRELGVQVAIDDFGTGWSSLTYLKQLPASIIKLDRSFVGRLNESPEDLAIAESVVRLGRATGATVVAEGVETAEQLAALRGLGCGAGQGFLWQPGVPAAEVAQAIRSVESRS